MRRRGKQLRLSAPRGFAASLVAGTMLVFAAPASALGGPVPPVTLGSLGAPVSTGALSSALGPVPVLPPSISGSAQQGQVVSCSPGTWLNSPTSYAYSWQRDVTTTVGTGSTYRITAADVDQSITCTVAASNPAGQASSLPSVPIVPLAALSGLAPVATAAPSISGSALEGRTVTCSSGSWLNSPTSYSYIWSRDGLPISGQTLAQYTLTASDVSQAVTCTVVAHNASGDSLPAISAPIIPALASVGGGGGGGGGNGGGSGSGTGKGGTGGGRGGTGIAKLHAPTIKAFSVSPSTLVVVVKGKRRSTKGATFKFTLDQKAGVLIELYERETGRVNGKGCGAPTRRNAKAKHCVRWVGVKALSVKSAKAGAGKLKYAGRVGKKLIATGAYRAYAAAVGVGGWSKLRWTALSVAQKKVKAPMPKRPKTLHWT